MNRGERSLSQRTANLDGRTIWVVLVLFLTGAAVCPHDLLQSPMKEIHPMNATHTTMDSASAQQQAPVESVTGLAELPSHLETATFALG